MTLLTAPPGSMQIISSAYRPGAKGIKINVTLFGVKIVIFLSTEVLSVNFGPSKRM